MDVTCNMYYMWVQSYILQDMKAPGEPGCTRESDTETGLKERRGEGDIPDSM
jgi:hypothetical protein